MTSIVAHELPRTTPEQQGIASAAILRFVEALDSQIHEPHSFMLLRHGSVVAEGWWSPYAPEHPHMMFSVSKSFTSTAVGLAVAEERFSIDDFVLSFFPAEAPADPSEYLTQMRVRDLLNMSTGHADDSFNYMMAREDGNWIKGFFDTPIPHAPGTHFLYDTGATYMLAALLYKVTGIGLVEYLQPRLFTPLGIENATWDESPQGIAIGGYGLNIKTEDLARFGQLYLQRGRWNDVQLLPEAWIEAATSTQIANGDSSAPSDWTQGYGYQFWRCRHGAYQASGVFGQDCIVMPEQDAVLALTSGVDVFEVQGLLDVVWDNLLPAFAAEPLPENPDAHEALVKQLSLLSLPPAHGQGISPLAARVSGRTFEVDTNALKIEAVTLNFAQAGCTVRLKTPTGEETLSCGYDAWQHGQTSVFNSRWIPDGFTPIVASGGWMTVDCFTMIVRLYKTPFFHTLEFNFIGDEMMIETRINASIDALQPLLLTAHPV